MPGTKLEDIFASVLIKKKKKKPKRVTQYVIIAYE